MKYDDLTPDEQYEWASRSRAIRENRIQLFQSMKRDSEKFQGYLRFQGYDVDKMKGDENYRQKVETEAHQHEEELIEGIIDSNFRTFLREVQARRSKPPEKE